MTSEIQLYTKKALEMAGLPKNEVNYALKIQKYVGGVVDSIGNAVILRPFSGECQRALLIAFHQDPSLVLNYEIVITNSGAKFMPRVHELDNSMGDVDPDAGARTSVSNYGKSFRNTHDEDVLHRLNGDDCSVEVRESQDAWRGNF